MRDEGKCQRSCAREWNCDYQLPGINSSHIGLTLSINIDQLFPFNGIGISIDYRLHLMIYNLLKPANVYRNNGRGPSLVTVMECSPCVNYCIKFFFFKCQVPSIVALEELLNYTAGDVCVQCGWWLTFNVWLEIEAEVSLCEGHQLIKSTWWLGRFKFIAVVSVFRWLACKYFYGNKCCWRLFCCEIRLQTWKIPRRLCNRMETEIFAYFCVVFEGKNIIN